MSVELVKPTAESGMEAVYTQEFSVRYDYPVHFTEHLFARDNPVFVQSIVRREPARRHRLVVFVDANVAASWPTLVHDIAAYTEGHSESLELVGRPEVVAGGEQVKNDPALVTGLQRHLVDLKIDRHAFVVGIGGGAFLDMIGFV
ncbi:MAG TPA: 3-dehydroquinate synthase, partial [Burkholderiales bacterium]|nr:3-dehydroquinate synthase [Burkholderiales bacterium]